MRLGAAVLNACGYSLAAEGFYLAQVHEIQQGSEINLKASQRSVDNHRAGENLRQRSDTLDLEPREYT